MKRNFRYTAIIILIFLGFIQCQNGVDMLNYEVERLSIEYDEDILNSLPSGNRAHLYFIDEKPVFYGVDDKNQLIIADFSTGEFKKHPIADPTPMIRAFNFKKDEISFIKQDTLYTYNISSKHLELITPLSMAQGEFVLSNIYNPYLYKMNDFYFFHNGNHKGMSGFGSHVLNFINADSTFKAIEKPEILNDFFIHYTDLLISQHKENFYFSFATLPHIYKWNMEIDDIKKIDLPNQNYLKYDTTKYTDMLYLHDYTYETTYNTQLLTDEQFVYFIYRTTLGEKNLQFHLNVYDHNLNLFKSIELDHDGYKPHTENGKIHFFSKKDKSIYTYRFTKTDNNLIP